MATSAVLRAPGVRPLLVASILARMPYAMTSIATVLLVAAQRDSFADAGLVSGVMALSGAVLAPLLGGLVDRRGQPGVIVAATLAQSLAVSALVGLVLTGAPLGAIVATAALSGSLPPVSAALRQLWPGLVRGDPALTQAAFALDAIVLEAIFVTGPLLVGLLVAFASPQAAILAAVGLSLTGSLWFAVQPSPRAWRPVARAGPRPSALRFRGLRTLMPPALGIGVIFGTFELCHAKFATELDVRWAAGALIAAQALGSATGGLLFARRPLGGAGLRRLYLVLVVAFPLASALYATSPGLAVGLVLGYVSGMPFAALSAAESLIVGEVTGEAVRTEAFTWIITAIVVGVAAGAATAGPLLEAWGWRPTLLVACGFGLATAAVALVGRRTLRPLAVG